MNTGPLKSEIVLDLSHWENSYGEWNYYTIAGITIKSNVSFENMTKHSLESSSIRHRQSSVGFSTYRRQINGWVGNANRNVTIHGDHKSLKIIIDNLASFTLTNLSEVRLDWVTPDLSKIMLLELVLGPPIAIILASYNVWLLHAGSVSYLNQSIAFSGDSGSGKSTLSNYCCEHFGASLISDDIAPLFLHSDELYISTSFPRLKPTHKSRAGFENLPITNFIEINYNETEPGFSVLPLNQKDTVLFFVRHSVSLRAMPIEFHQNHLRFINSIVPHTHCLSANYSHDKRGVQAFSKFIPELIGRS